MNREEFESLTGFRPTLGMYKVIEQEYMDSKQDKAEFCRAYVLNIGGIAEKIQRIADMAEIEQRHEIAELQEQLDAELEWRYCAELGTYLDQEDYKEKMKRWRTIPDKEAIELLAETFGFMPEKTKIRHKAEEFEENKYGLTRVKTTFLRDPIYYDPYHNYIRFDCADKQWELIDGELISYDR